MVVTEPAPLPSSLYYYSKWDAAYAVRFGGSSPDGEDVTNLIDGTKFSKYLNFGGRDTGVYLDYGSPVVKNVAEFVSANDAPHRDPYNFKIYGTNQLGSLFGLPNYATASWTLLDSSVRTNLPTARETVAPLAEFENQTAYRYYKVVFTGLRGGGSDDYVQLAELTLATKPTPTTTIDTSFSFELDAGVGIDWQTQQTTMDNVVTTSDDLAVTVPISGGVYQGDLVIDDSWLAANLPGGGSVAATGTIFLDQVDPSSYVTLDVTAAGLIGDAQNLTLTGSITGDVSLSSSGSFGIGDLTAGGNLRADAQLGLSVRGEIDVSGWSHLATGGDLSFENGAVVATSSLSLDVTGDVATTANAGTVDLGDTGAISGHVGGDAYLQERSGDLRLGRLSATGDMAITSATGDLVGLQTGPGATLRSGGTLTLATPSGSVLDDDGGPLETIQSTLSFDVSGDVDIRSTGTVRLSTSSAGGLVDIFSTGVLRVDGQMDSNANMSLTSWGDLSTAAVVTSVSGRVDLASLGGDVSAIGDVVSRGDGARRYREPLLGR